MTDPVKEISRTGEVSSGGASGGGETGHGHKKKQIPPDGKDLVEISQDARDRLAGKSRKSIMEYLRGLLG